LWSGSLRVVILRASPAPRSRYRTLFLALPWLLATAGCGDGGNGDDSCVPDDQDGVIGGENTVLLTVSDAAFAVGGVGSGSTQRNITIQNSSNVTLTLTNVGTRPHSFVIQCIPSELPAGCPRISCFPDTADIPAVAPEASATVKFTVPVVEGAYPFSSDVPGDEALLGQFVIN
jgi:hypothetical protein